MSRIWRKQFHKPESCSSANVLTRSGRSTRMEKQRPRRLHTGTCGMRSRRVWWSRRVARTYAATKSRCPNGVPKIRMPWSLVDRPDPHHTRALGSTTCAVRSRTSQCAGRSLAAFHTTTQAPIVGTLLPLVLVAGSTHRCHPRKPSIALPRPGRGTQRSVLPQRK